jgi:superfamily II DNA or RNA helicase
MRKRIDILQESKNETSIDYTYRLDTLRADYAYQLQKFLADKEAMEFYTDFQKTGFRKGLEHFGEKKHTTGLYDYTTGSGKGEMCLGILDALYKREPKIQKPRTFYITSTIKLAQDAARRFEKKGLGVPHGIYHSHEKELENPITFITYDSFYDLVNAGIIKPEEVDMLLLDEAHRGLTDKRRDIFNKFKLTSLIQGFSGSPEFSQIKGAWRILGETIHSVTAEFLIGIGFMPPRANIIVDYEYPQNAKPTYQMRRKAYTDLVVATLLGYKDGENKNQSILNEKGLIYAFDKDHAKEIADRLNSDSKLLDALKKITGNNDIVPATVVDGDMSQGELDTRFKAQKDGKTQILIGAKIFIEGHDMPYVNWIMQRPSGSIVETIQPGGRPARSNIQDPSKVTRIFNLNVAGNKENPANPVYFYSDVMGTPRLGNNPKEPPIELPTGVKLTTIPSNSNIKIYNKPHDVEEFISRFRSARNKGTTVRRLYPQGMIVETGMWPAEVERMYEVIHHRYNQDRASSNSSDLLEVIGHYIPKHMLKETTAIDNTTKILVIKDEAASVLQDWGTPLLEESEVHMTEKDVLRAIRGSSYNPQTIKNIFKDLTELYTTAYLEAKYPLEGKPQPEPKNIIYQGKEISMQSLEMMRTDDGIVLGIHEKTIGQFLHPEVQPKKTSDLGQSEFASLIGTTVSNQAFLNAWGEVKHHYNRRPFTGTTIDGHPVKCAHTITKGATKPNFTMDVNEKEWFEEQVEKWAIYAVSGNFPEKVNPVEDKTPIWLNKTQTAAAVRTSPTTNKEFSALWKQIKDMFYDTPTEPVIIDESTDKEHIVKCGRKRNASGAEFYIHMDEVSWIQDKLGMDEKQRRGRGSYKPRTKSSFTEGVDASRALQDDSFPDSQERL